MREDFYLFRHPQAFSAYHCFNNLLLFHYRLNQLRVIYQEVNFDGLLLVSDRSHEIQKMYHLKLQHGLSWHCVLFELVKAFLILMSHATIQALKLKFFVFHPPVAIIRHDLLYYLLVKGQKLCRYKFRRMISKTKLNDDDFQQS